MFLFSCSSMKSSIVPSRRAASTKSRLDRIRSVILSGPIQILSTPQGERIRECCHVFLHFVFTENRALIARHFKVQSFVSLIGRMIYFPQSFAFLIGWLCISYEFFAGFFTCKSQSVGNQPSYVDSIGVWTIVKDENIVS